MNTIFKSALNQVKAEDELVKNTETYLKNNLNQKGKGIMNFFNNGKTLKKLVAAACFTLVLAGGGKAAYAYYWTPVAYLSLDINPSVELGVNAFNTVVSAEAYNEDGQAILAGTDLTGTSVTDAVETLIESADNKGYIAEDGSTVISLTSETDNTDKATSIQTNSETGVTQALDKIEKEATVQKDNVALARRDEAKELGITPGKLNLIQKLQAVDPTATVEDFKDASVKEIMKTIKENSKNAKSEDTSDETPIENATKEDATLPSDEEETKNAEKKQNSNDKSNNGKKSSTTEVTTAAESSTENTTSDATKTYNSDNTLTETPSKAVGNDNSNSNNKVIDKSDKGNSSNNKSK